MSPTPLWRHARTVRELFRFFLQHCPDGLAPVDMVTIELPGSEERYIPDLVVLPEDAAEDDEWLLSVSDVALAAEITSPGNPESDRVRKLRGYAEAAVPLYLLIDTEKETATLFEEPDRGDYRRRTEVDLGMELSLPAPFKATLDTAPFATRQEA